MLGFIKPPGPYEKEIWVGESGFVLEVGGATRGNVFIRRADNSLDPKWSLPGGGGGQMAAGQAWWHWHEGYLWPTNFDLKPLTPSTRLYEIPEGGQLDKFTSQAFPANTVGHPQLDGWRTWELTLRKADGTGVKVGFLTRSHNGTLHWSAHKDKIAGGSRIDSRTDTLEFRDYFHDMSCMEWCHDEELPIPCGVLGCGQGHGCMNEDYCEAHAASCGLNNTYRAIVSALL